MTDPKSESKNSGWRLPRQSPEWYASTYCESVRGIAGVLGVWAIPYDATLEIFTLIKPDRELERRLHDAELAFFDEVGDAPIAIHLYDDPELLDSYVKGIDSLLPQR